MSQDTNQHDLLNDWIGGAVPGLDRSIEVAKHQVPGEAGRMDVTFKQEITPLVRKESPRRAHKFYTADGFIAYLKSNATPRTLVLGSPAANQIIAVLDESAKVGLELVSLVPQVHPLLDPWQNILTSTVTFPLDNFVKFIRMNANVICTPTPKELLSSLCQIRVSKTMQAHYGADGLGMNGVMIETTIQGNATRTVVSIPDSISIAVPMYLGRDTVRLTIDISMAIEESDKKPTVTCWSPNFATLKIAEFEEMLAIVGSEAGQACVVDLGTVTHVAWDYLS